MIDTHCHLTHAKFDDDRGEAIGRAVEAGLSACITIGTGVDDARRVGQLCLEHPGFLFGTAGLDPFSSHRCGDRFDEALQQLTELFQQFSFCAVGEIGLDYHYDLDSKPLQRLRFSQQLELAQRLSLPVVIHVREAHEDMAAVLAEHSEVRGVIHSFTGGPKEAERYLELGWMLAFNGVMTFKNAAEVREAAQLTPQDRVLVETDSPYLAPMPLRGKRCEPAYVAHTLARLAEVRNESVEQLRETTSQNARDLFGL